MLLQEKSTEDNFLLIYDIGKEMYAFTISGIYPKHLIERDSYGEDIVINDPKFKYLDFVGYKDQLIAIRMKLKM